MDAQMYEYAVKKLLTLDIPAGESQMMVLTINALNQAGREALEMEEANKIDRAIAERQAELDLDGE